MVRPILIAGLLCISSCGKRMAPSIIGTNISYEQGRLLIENTKDWEKQKKHILVLVNHKECSWDRFSYWVKNGKIKTFSILKDPSEIQKINMPNRDVKVLISATQ